MMPLIQSLGLTLLCRSSSCLRSTKIKDQSLSSPTQSQRLALMLQDWHPGPTPTFKLAWEDDHFNVLAAKMRLYKSSCSLYVWLFLSLLNQNNGYIFKRSTWLHVAFSFHVFSSNTKCFLMLETLGSCNFWLIIVSWNRNTNTETVKSAKRHVYFFDDI